MGSSKVKQTKRGSNLEKLTDKQRRFVELYLSDSEMNATKAARDAGYAGANASAQLMSNKAILAAIGKATKDLSDRAKITQEDVVAELASLGFSNLQNYIDANGDYIPLQDLPPMLAACIHSVDYVNQYDAEGRQIGRKVVGYHLYDKMGPLMHLGKHLGMFDDKLKIEASGSLDGVLSAILTRIENTKPVIDSTDIKRLAAE